MNNISLQKENKKTEVTFQEFPSKSLNFANNKKNSKIFFIAVEFVQCFLFENFFTFHES